MSELTASDESSIAAARPGTVGLPDAEVHTDTRTSPDRLWNVIVWDDPINLMSWVTYVFQKVFGYSEQLAARLMIEVHTEGRSIVATVEREKAEIYVGQLHSYGLQATLEKQAE